VCRGPLDTPALFFATAALVGSGYTLLLVALQNQLGRLPDEVERKAGLSRFASATAVSGALGPFVAGHAMAHGGVRWCFLLLAGLSIASLAAAWRWRLRLHGAATAPARASPGSLSLRTAVSQRATRRLLMADLLIAVAWNANGFIVPLQAVQRGWPADVVGNLLGAFGFAVWLVRAVMPAWQRRLGDWQAIRVALATGGACFVLFPFASSLPAAFVLQAVLGLGLGISLPAVLALLHTHAPSERSAETLGLRVAVLNVSYVVLPLVMGGLGAAIGLSIVFWSIGAGLSAGAVSLRSTGTAP
jgi:MFS family permease